ncbi:MAG TPA: hypothetical protein VMZ92_13275 [Planctomycetota bacterium]|nr:hypothetical protein [Planctomycetota bacterium]
MKCTECFFSDANVTDETCRRCSRNFTRRELVDIVLFGLIYLFVCRFSHYLFTGDFFSDPLGGGVLSPVRFSDVFAFPVNFAEHPWHVFTVGWTFALVLMIPMLVGLFYGPVAGVVVALVGAYHVAVPFFFVPVTLSAVMAGTRLGRRVGLEAALLLATVPPVLHLVGLSLVVFTGQPRMAVMLPWLVTVLLVVVSISPTIWLGRRWEYRMRPLVWVVGLQAVMVVAVFHGSIGFAKVEYEFVRRKYWSGGERFRILVEAPDAGQHAEEPREKARALFESRRTRSLKELSRFISWFPRSPETPLALFERAEAYNLRSRFAGTRPDMLRVYTTRITPEALADYHAIRNDFSVFPVAIEARLRIARYHLQTQRLDEAMHDLRDLIDYCDVKVPLNYRPADTRSVLLRWRTHRLTEEERLQLLYEVLQEARLELRFLERNSDYNRIPLMLLYQLDGHGDDYVGELRKILKWFPDCRLADNIHLALLERRAYELDELEALLNGHPADDAAPRMLLLLGTGYRDRLLYDRAEDFLTRLTRTFPKSPEAARAAVLLRDLKPDTDKP